MITSNINELQFLANVKNDELNNKNSDFLEEVKNSSENEEFSTTKTNSFSFDNIKGITTEEIEHLFENEDDKQMAKNLRLATLFSNDDNLAKAMFNTVLGQPFNVGYTFLSNRYEDKHNYFSSLSDNSKLSDLLHQSMTNKINNKDMKPTDQIPQEQLDEILLEVNSFSFLDALNRNSKDQYGRYKDEDNDYSFLYNDYALQYEQLMQKYKDLENQNNNIINQF